ncbi:MAG: response regulator transcription factor [Chloroflexi bacterium]|nr:response regulator transcription factor [Chloroflexota bacterium]
MIHVTIVSPNPVLRIGLRGLLDGHSDVKVVGEAVSLEDLEQMETEVVLLASVSFARISEFDLNDRAILLLTDNQEDAKSLLRAKARAWGVLSLNATEDELLAGVRAVGEGLWVGAAGLVSGLMRDEGRVRLIDGESLAEPLTAREKEVLQLMAEGMANKQIALSLGISEHTVKFHLSSLYAKMNVSSRTEAIKTGLGLGLISI